MWVLLTRDTPLRNAASVDTLSEAIARLKLSFGARSVGMNAMPITTLR